MHLTHPSRQIKSIPTDDVIETDDVYVMPASVAQQRFWILDQLDPGSSSLNMPLALSLNGSLNIDTLERVVNEVGSRHEVLRTTFSRNNGKPVQVIAAKQSFPLNFDDLSDSPDKEIECNRIRVEEAHYRFDLERGPLFRARLIRLATEDHVLLLTLHHIICDGWSNGVLIREIGGIYAAFSKGDPSPFEELRIQYADFAAWQEEWLKSDSFEDQLAFWKSQLGDELPALDIPTDLPRNGNRTSFGDIESLLLTQPLTRAIKALSQREDATPFMIFLTAFNILLQRYSGQDTILIGSPTANRQQSETEGLIGAFANTLLLKTDVSGAPTFRQLLSRVKNVSLGAFSNQTLPFEKLVEHVRPSTNGRKGGLFQVMFIFQTAFMQPVELDQLSITPMRSVSPGSIFELSLGVVERTEGTRLQMEYNTDLFKAETIGFMLADLRCILEAAVLDPGRSSSDLLSWTTPLRSAAPDVLVSGSSPDSTSGVSVLNAVADESVERTLTKIWQDVLQIDSIGRDDDFFEIGGHSLIAAQLFDEIKKRLGVNLPLATLFTATTIEQLAKLIHQERPKDKWTSLVPINVDGTRPPLFLMHGVGGNVLFYKNLAMRLGAEQPCFGLQAVGLSGHEPPYDRIEDMAAHYIKEIRKVQPKGPYFLGGGSYGGLIAFEMASQFEKAGDEVALVVMFDSGAPGYLNPAGKRYKLKDQLMTGLDHVKHHLETILMHESNKRWPYVVSRVVRGKRKIQQLSQKTLGKIVAVSFNRQESASSDPLILVSRAAVKAAKTYSPPQFPGDVLLFRASKQHRGKPKDATLGWSKFVTGNIDIREINGIHQSILAEPRVRFVAEILQDHLG